MEHSEARDVVSKPHLVVGFTMVDSEFPCSLCVMQVSLLGESTRIVRRITDDVLMISKVDSDQFNLLFAPLSVPDVLHSTVKQYKRAAEVGCVQVTVTTDCDLPSTLLGDADRIGQVLSNFMSNGM